MPWTDLPLDELRRFASDVEPAGDLAEFWAERLELARGAATETTIVPVDHPLTQVRISDVDYSGAEGHRIRAWLLEPVGLDGPLPCLVRFIGYGGGRMLPHAWTLWPAAGWATLVMDTRGQAGADTPDPGFAGNPQASGFTTRGVDDPRTHYYSRVFVDAARAVEVARELPQVDPQRVAVGGGSQGGGIAIAAAALSPDLIGALVDYPFWCDVLRASTLTDTHPYAEVAEFLRARPYALPALRRTLSYLDGVVLAGLATAPALFSVGLMDDICPPSTGYAAYNVWSGPKEMHEYAWSRHEGGAEHHVRRQLDWLTARVGSR